MKTFTLTKTYLKRILAFIIDYTIFLIPILFLFILSTPLLSPILSSFFPENIVGVDFVLFIFFIIPYSFVMLFIYYNILEAIIYSLVVIAIYSLIWTTTLFLFEFLFQRTIGKFFTHLKVCNLDGSRISFLKSFARNFIKFFFFATLPFLLLPFWGSGTQGLHDKICRTKVIDAPKYSKSMHILQYVVAIIVFIIFLLIVYLFWYPILLFFLLVITLVPSMIKDLFS